jgi:two-component system sensor histidine kinase KdpD
MRPLVARYLGSAVSVGVAALLAAAISQLVTLPHVSVLMLVAVFFSAVRWGLGPSLFAATCAVATSSFFFMPPIYSFYVSAPQDVIDLVVFFVAAVVTSQLASRLKQHAADAARREMTVRQLSGFIRNLAGILDPDGLLRATAVYCTVTLQRRAVLLIPKDAALIQFAAESGLNPLSNANMDHAMQWLNDSQISVGASRKAAHNGWTFHVLSGKKRPSGLLAVEIAFVPLTQDDERMIDSILPQVSGIVERTTSVVNHVV